MKKAKIIIILIELIFMYVLGWCVGVKQVLDNITPHTEEGNIIVIELWENEWVYEM